MTAVLDIPTIEKLLPMLEPRRFKGLHGGRGGAKSHFFSERMVEDCLVETDLRCMCIREHQVSLRNSSMQDLKDQIERLGVGYAFDVLNTHINVLDYRNPVKQLRGRADGHIIFLGMKNHTADSVKSLKGYKRAWIEEAQRLSKTSLEKLTPTLRISDSEIWASWNPSSPKDPVDKFFRKELVGDPDACTIEINYWDNPFFPDVLRRDMERDKARDPDKYQHIWCGGYNTKSDARVFKNWKIGDAEEIDYLFDIAKKRRLYLGADWGYANDPTVLVCAFIVGRSLYIAREAVRVGLEIDHTAKFFKEEIPECVSWPITGDSSRPETISYVRRHGLPLMHKSKKGAGSVEDGVEFIKSYDIIVHPSCVHTIDELTWYSWEVDPLTEEVLPVLADKKNHVIDALRYSVESTRRAKGAVL